MISSREMKDTISFEAAVVLYARALAEEKQATQLRRVCFGLLNEPPARAADVKFVSCEGCDTRQLLQKVMTMLAQNGHNNALLQELSEVGTPVRQQRQSPVMVLPLSRGFKSKNGKSATLDAQEVNSSAFLNDVPS